MDAAAPTCAVCKHLGKQCDETCILGPYFPIDKAEDFHCVHKVFGISNLTKIVSSVEENERATTVETLIVEAKIRMHDEVHGSFGVKKKLEAAVTNAEKELNSLKQQLRFLQEETEEAAPPLPKFAGPSNRDSKGKRKM